MQYAAAHQNHAEPDGETNPDLPYNVMRRPVPPPTYRDAGSNGPVPVHPNRPPIGADAFKWATFVTMPSLTAEEKEAMSADVPEDDSYLLQNEPGIDLPGRHSYVVCGQLLACGKPCAHDDTFTILDVDEDFFFRGVGAHHDAP